MATSQTFGNRTIRDHGHSEADVLRDEGEAYGGCLRATSVPVTTVRYDSIAHDFMMLNPLSATHATRAAPPTEARRFVA